MSSSERTRLAHIVLFKLKDASDAACDKLIAACDAKLSQHPGILFYGAGRRGEEFSRPVNDSDYDVGLHVIFESKTAHDVYQECDDHVAFLAENRDNFAGIRISDTYV